MNKQIVRPFDMVLYQDFSGVIQVGKHDEQEGAACALEIASVARGNGLSDKPTDAGLPTLWPLSDGLCIWPDDQTRTQQIVPLVKALWDWPNWSEEQQEAWKRRVIQRTIREVFPYVLRSVGLEAEADYCVQVGTIEAADAAHSAAKGAVENARKVADSFRMLDAVRAREAANFVVKAARKRENFDIAYAAYNVAFAVGGIARSRDVDGVGSKVDGVSAVDVLSLACEIWREEAERTRPLRSN